jgi:RimJ/RimL family protein N-acetyltransferase
MLEPGLPAGAGGRPSADAVLTTGRLLLRPFRGDDLEAYAEIVGDAVTMRSLGSEPLKRDQAWRHLALLAGHRELRGFAPRAVEEQGSGLLVGRVGLWFPEGWPEVELSWLVRRDRWGRGYATEAAGAVLEHGFRSYGFERLVSYIAPDNAASARVAEKLGALPEGVLMLRGQALVAWRHRP